MLAARQQDPEALRRHYEAVDEIILSIDGLQPEKGHETLYVVRELTRKRVWFAEPLLSATADEVRRLIAKAKEWAESLGKPVGLWISDKQDAFVTGIAAEFPDVPHRYCDNHFLRDLAKPVLEADSHAKVQMRKKVRGLRTIEQAVLQRQEAEAPKGLAGDDPEATVTVIAGPANRASSPRSIPPAPWCSTIARRCAGSSMTIREDRSILPACGWPRRWTRSASRSNGTWTRKKGVRGGATRPPGRLHRPGLGRSPSRARVDPRVRRGHRGGGRDPRARERRVATERQEKFEELIDRFEPTEDPIRRHMATVMLSFLAGLFVGEDKFEEIKDNLDLERWFRLPKSHERRIHGHRHAGVRIVQDGPTLVPRPGRTRRASRAVHRRRPVAVSDGPRAAVPT